MHQSRFKTSMEYIKVKLRTSVIFIKNTWLILAANMTQQGMNLRERPCHSLISIASSSGLQSKLASGEAGASVVSRFGGGGGAKGVPAKAAGSITPFTSVRGGELIVGGGSTFASGTGTADS